MVKKNVLTALVLGSILLGCNKVPLTGRSQMNLLSTERMMATSLKQYNQFLEKNKAIKGTQKANQVKAIGNDIATSVENYLRDNGFKDMAKSFEWEFNLVKKDKVNAWCMPGGKVVFYSGIMPICQDRSGISVVMAHEIAHAVARHGNERMSQMLATKLGGVALSTAMSEETEETQNLVMKAYGVGAQVGVMLPYSRTHESEADRMGLVFMAMAGYNPREAVDFWQRMKAKSDGQTPPEFLSTHPSNQKRINQLKDAMDQALKYYKP